MTDSANSDTSTSIECPAPKDPAVREFIKAVLLFGFGIWCLTDLRPVPKAWTFDNINDVGGYLLNNWGPFLFFPGGLLFALKGILGLRRVLVADADGIGYKCGAKIAWDDITEVDAARLGKGFLDLKAGEKNLLLDSWKLQNFKELVAFVEDHVPDAKIKR